MKDAKTIRMIAFGSIVLVGSVLLASATPGERTIAQFSTTLDGRSRDQRHNAFLSAKSLDGAIIQPNEVFSFNSRIGTFSRDAGYRRAPVSYNGTLIESWGGGVCQTSTTLYNVFLLAGMPIIERHRHRFWPSYVVPGRDAAVAFGQYDLKARNNFGGPIRVHAKVEGDRLVVSLTGDVEARPLARIETVSLSKTEARSFRIGKGTPYRTRNAGKDGYDVATYRHHKDGRELVSEDHYPPMHKIIELRPDLAAKPLNQ